MRKAVSGVRVVRQSRKIVEQGLAPRKGQDLQSSYLGLLVDSVPVARLFPVEDFVVVITGRLQLYQTQQ